MPWAMLSGGGSFDDFVDQFAIAATQDAQASWSDGHCGAKRSRRSQLIGPRPSPHACVPVSNASLAINLARRQALDRVARSVSGQACRQFVDGPTFAEGAQCDVGLGLIGTLAFRAVPVEVTGERVTLCARGEHPTSPPLRPWLRPAAPGTAESTIAVRSTDSIARPSAEEICSRLAIRRTSLVRFVPAPWNSAGLKNTASPARSSSCT